MQEEDFIRMIAAHHRRAPEQYGGLYEADAEIIRRNGRFLVFSMDGFSESEDFFRHTAPYRTGRNMAIAAAGDLLACGVVPYGLLQQWDLDPARDPHFYEQAADGIESVLRECGAFCLGGDTGSAAPWRYGALFFAETERTPVTRKIREKRPFHLWLSGTVGDANAACFRNREMPEFELRLDAARWIADHALCATDTSGGLFDALENFRRVNPDVRFELDLDRIPYAPEVSALPCPPEFALIGGCGEYELLFTQPEECGEPAGAVCIGCGSFSAEPGVFFRKNGSRYGRMKNPPPDYRTVSPDQYLSVTETCFKEISAP